jgi:hypothetical protein
MPYLPSKYAFYFHVLTHKTSKTYYTKNQPDTKGALI